MLGKSELPTNNLTAAKRIFKKTILCVDNLSAECTESDLVAFMQDMGVNVISCNVTKTRLRRNESHEDEVVKARKAFRVCIDSEDKDRLLHPQLWADSVIISEWYFKQATQQQQRQQAWSGGVGVSDKRRRVDRAGAGDDVIDVARSRDTVGVTTDHTEPKQPEDMDASAAGDDTLILATDGQNGGD